MFYKFTVIASLAIILVSIVSMAIWGFDTKLNPSYDIEIRLGDNTVFPGQVVQLMWGVIALRENVCQSFVELYYEDRQASTRILVDSAYRLLEHEDNRTVTYVRIPSSLEPGEYSYNITISYYCNPYDRLFGPNVVHKDYSFTVFEEPDPDEEVQIPTDR